MFSRTLAGFGLINRQKIHFSTFACKLEFQCPRNGPQNPPYCPGSPEHLSYLFLDISPTYFSNIFRKKKNLENRKSENLEIQKPRFTNRSPVLTNWRSKRFLFIFNLGQNGGFWGPFLIHWSSNLLSNVEKWTFWRPVRPDRAKVREKSFVWSVRSSRTPLDLPNFNLNYRKNTFLWKTRFSQVH